MRALKPPSKIFVLMNAAAGSMSRGDDPRTQIAAAFARQGAKCTIRRVSGDRIADAAREFMDRQANGQSPDGETLTVAGGDGTISAVAGVLAGSELPLGILPLGTLNHFAKDLGLPLDLDAATNVIVTGNVRKVDVGELNGRVFVNNSSIGLYPFMVARRNAHQRQRGVGKMIATLPAMIETLRQASWHRLDVGAAGERQRMRTPCIFVGNNPYEVGFATFGRRTHLDCGKLDVHVVRQQSRTGVLLLPFKIALGIVDPQRDVQTFRCPELEILSRRHRALRVSLDGELVRMETPLRYQIRPRALSVYGGPPPRQNESGA